MSSARTLSPVSVIIPTQSTNFTFSITTVRWQHSGAIIRITTRKSCSGCSCAANCPLTHRIWILILRHKAVIGRHRGVTVWYFEGFAGLLFNVFWAANEVCLPSLVQTGMYLPKKWLTCFLTFLFLNLRAQSFQSTVDLRTINPMGLTLKAQEWFVERLYSRST
jgi:hypothetical protein